MEPPFYSLSSSGSSSSTDNSALISSSPATHDTSRSTFHISEIASFAENLQDAANQAFPNRGRSRYHTVNVCLIRWEEDELEVKGEVDRLHAVFDELYGFNTEIWLIPSSASQIQLTSMACQFLQKFDAEGNLFIVYYGGHGKINDARQNQWWCNSRPDSAFVDWSAIQTLFGTAVSDVLILLDCCAAASSAAGSGPGTMEAIAACGWETRAPPPGEHSFTNTLIETLEDWACKPSFSAAMLHTEVLFVLKQKRPERGRDGRRLEWCSTPIHWVYTGNPKALGIEISSLRIAEASKKTAPREQLPQPRSTSYIDPMELDGDGALENPLTACRPDGDYLVPHVLISIALEGDQGNLDAVSCRRWLSDFPALAKYATVEGVYKGYSTLITLSVPVMVWDLLPDDPACMFIGYLASPNKYNQPSHMQEIASFFATQSLEKDSSLRSSRQHTKDTIRSCDSSYGSDYSPIRGHSPSWPSTEVEGEDSDREWEDDDQSDYDEASSGSGDLIEDIAHVRQKEKIATDSKPGASLISHMLKDEVSSKPIDIQSKKQPKKHRYRSPDQIALSPRSTRRNMLCTELSSSLRRHLSWERQKRATAKALPSASPRSPPTTTPETAEKEDPKVQAFSRWVDGEYWDPANHVEYV